MHVISLGSVKYMVLCDLEVPFFQLSLCVWTLNHLNLRVNHMRRNGQMKTSEVGSNNTVAGFCLVFIISLGAVELATWKCSWLCPDERSRNDCGFCTCSLREVKWEGEFLFTFVDSEFTSDRLCWFRWLWQGRVTWQVFCVVFLLPFVFVCNRFF